MRKIVLLSLIVILAVLAITVSYIFVYTYLTPFAISVLSQDLHPHIVENSYVRLSTDKFVYSKGEPVVFTIKNNSPYVFSSSGADYGVAMSDMHGNVNSYGCPTCELVSEIHANSSFTGIWQQPDPYLPDYYLSGYVRICNSLYSSDASDYYTLCSFIIIND